MVFSLLVYLDLVNKNHRHICSDFGSASCHFDYIFTYLSHIVVLFMGPIYGNLIQVDLINVVNRGILLYVFY